MISIGGLFCIVAKNQFAIKSTSIISRVEVFLADMCVKRSVRYKITSFLTRLHEKYHESEEQ